jgi:hypothetical protein
MVTISENSAAKIVASEAQVSAEVFSTRYISQSAQGEDYA